MTYFRAAILAALFAGVGVGLVALRVEQTRVAARTLRMESEWVHARRSLWAMQTRVARLQTPRRLRDHVAFMGASFVPLHFVDDIGPGVWLVADRDQE